MSTEQMLIEYELGRQEIINQSELHEYHQSLQVERQSSIIHPPTTLEHRLSEKRNLQINDLRKNHEEQYLSYKQKRTFQQLNIHRRATLEFQSQMNYIGFIYCQINKKFSSNRLFCYSSQNFEQLQLITQELIHSNLINFIENYSNYFTKLKQIQNIQFSYIPNYQENDFNQSLEEWDNPIHIKQCPQEQDQQQLQSLFFELGQTQIKLYNHNKERTKSLSPCKNGQEQVSPDQNLTVLKIIHPSYR